MKRSFAQLTILALFAIAAGSSALGCEAHVESGEGGGGGGVGGGSAEACTVGDVRDCPTPNFTKECVEINGKAQWSDCTDPNGMTSSTTTTTTTSTTPLVLSFDGGPVQMSADSAHGFTLSATGSMVTDWPTAKTPWLALDLDGSGSIDDGRELFGSMTALKTGGLAVNGFVALRELDANGDGKLTAEDPGFAKLLLWSDRDQDRRSSALELTSAAKAEIVSIDLDYTSDRRCDARGNCEIERASFQYRDASGALRTGAIVDVHLLSQR